MRKKAKFKADISKKLSDKKYKVLINSVVNKLKFSLHKGVLVNFPLIQNQLDYDILIDSVSKFIIKLYEDEYSEFPNILLKGIDNSLTDFHFDGYSEFVDKKYRIFKETIPCKIDEVKAMINSDNFSMYHSKYNQNISDYALTKQGYDYIDILVDNSNMEEVSNSLDDFLEEY